MQTQYYLAFASSTDLEQSAITLLEKNASGNHTGLEEHMEKAMEFFVPELMQAFLVDTVDAIGLSPMATKVVNSTAEIIDKTAKMLMGKLLKGRSNEELKPLIGFVDDIYLRPNTTSNGKACTGCEIEKERYDTIQRLIADVRGGKGQAVMPELIEVMGYIVDVMLEKLMRRPIDLLPLGFLMRKLTDGATATCRAAGHGVINKVFKKLDDDQLLNLANYFDTLVVSANR